MLSLEELKARAVKAAEKEANRNPLESEIEKPVKQYARDNGFWVRKFVSKAHRSVPDDVLAKKGVPAFFIEFKRKGEKPTKAQQDEHKEMREAGLAVYVIDNVKDGKALIDRLNAEAEWA
jgi:hypothetical protein